MAIEFGLELKQELTRLLGGKLVEYDSTIVLVRGGLGLRVEFFGDRDDDRVLGIRLLTSLDRARNHHEIADARRGLDGLPALLIRRKTPKDLGGKRFGLTREVQTADSTFDEQFFVESAAPDQHLRAVLGSSDTRQIAVTLLEDHNASISINRPGAELVVDHRVHELEVASVTQLAEKIEWSIEHTLALKASLPVFVGDKEATRPFPLVKWAYGLEGLSILSGFALGGFVAGFNWMPVDEQPLFVLLGIGLGAAVLFVPLSYLFARGHSRGLTHFAWLSLLGFFVFPMGSLGIGGATNCFFDTSPRQDHYVQAVEDPEHCSSDRRGVAVQDWRDKRKSIILDLGSSRLCSATKRGDSFHLVVKEGFWGWPWVRDFEPLS